MNKLFALLLLFTAALETPLFAQNLENIQYGPDNEQKTKILKILGENASGIFYMAAKGEDLYVQRYSNDRLSLEVNNKIDIPTIDNVKLELEEMFLMQNGILLFATGFDKTESTYKTYSFTISPDGRITNSGTLVFAMEVEKESRGGEVQYKVSDDKEHLLIYNKAFKKKLKTYTYSFILVDTEGDVKVEKSFDVLVDDKTEQVQVGTIGLDDENNIYCMITRTSYNKSTKEKVQDFEVLSYRAKNDFEPTKSQIELGTNNVISSAAFTLRNDGQLAVAGFYIPYKNGKRATGIEGTFYTTIDEEGAVSPARLQKLSDEFKAHFIKEQKVSKGIDLPMTYITKSVFVDANDNLTLVAEDFIFTPGQNAAGDTYYYGYIIAIKISNEGELIWEQYINKRQVYAEKSIGFGGFYNGLGVTAWIKITSDKNIYLSFYSWSDSKGNMIFLFNDNPKNEGVEDGDKRSVLQNAYKGVPVIAKITPDGELSYKFEKELGDDETTLRPRMSYDENDILYFVSSKRSIEKVGKAEIK